jgi:hypothetical protein
VVASQCWHPLFGANPWSLKCIWVRSVGRSWEIQCSIAPIT